MNGHTIFAISMITTCLFAWTMIFTKGSKLDIMTKVVGDLPPRVVGFLMSNVVFSPKSMPYVLMEHNHYKVGYAVQEVISEARKHGIKAPRLYAVENLITE